MTKPIKLTAKQKVQWMERLLFRAKIVGKEGEVPVAAVILDEYGKCIGQGSNRRERDSNPLGHAELIALRQASYIADSWRFNKYTLIVNLEPCPMCAGAIIQARMGQVIYGAKDTKRGALGGTIDLSKHISAHHKMIVYSGILEDKIKYSLQEWFKTKR